MYTQLLVVKLFLFFSLEILIDEVDIIWIRAKSSTHNTNAILKTIMFVLFRKDQRIQLKFLGRMQKVYAGMRLLIA